MRVLYLVHISELGGIQRCIVELALAMADRGHAVCVAAGGEENGYLFLTLQHDPRIETVHLRSITGEPFSLRWSCIRDLFRLIRRWKPDLIHLNGVIAYAGSLCARWTRVPAVYSPRGFILLDQLSWKGRAAFWVCERITSALVSLVLPSSIFEGEHMIRLLRYDRFRMVVSPPVPLIIFSEPLDPIQLAVEFAKETGIMREGPGPWVVSIANLFPQKGLEDLLLAFEQVFAEIPSARCVVIGEGPERATLITQIRSRGLEEQCFLAGSVQGASRYLPLFDLFVLSSHKEGSPAVLVEAAAAGLPVVATLVGGIPELKRQNWVLVPPRSPAALAQGILESRRQFTKHPPLSNAYLEQRFRLAVQSLEQVYRTVSDPDTKE